MKIYFGGSISGGREDAPIYFEIIRLLQDYGTVLTEHIGDKGLAGQEVHADGPSFIYERDMAWVRESDVIVAEVSVTSLGVGYELGQAEATGKRVICLYREGAARPLSQMITGNPRMEVIRYASVGELAAAFKDLFANAL